MSSHYDFEISLWRLRPPCPACRRRTWPDRGLDDEEIFLCLRHGYWIPSAIEDSMGDPLPVFRWERYEWRFV
jgi:hypothetical protein